MVQDRLWHITGVPSWPKHIYYLTVSLLPSFRDVSLMTS